MKIMMWLGNESNQIALANKINKQFPLSAIVIESRVSQGKLTPSSLLMKIFNKLFFYQIDKAWTGMRSYYTRKYRSWPGTELLHVENINDPKTLELVNKIKPDLILVSGTRLIKEPLLSIPVGVGILNLHTGLSPYIKGGPNCTNWCISTGQFEYIGNTVMWIDKGIDTGDLLTTESCVFSSEKNLTEVHISVMEQAHALYIKAIQAIQSNKKTRISQASIAKGKTYFSKDWNMSRRFDLIRNLGKFMLKIKHQELNSTKSNIKTIKPA